MVPVSVSVGIIVVEIRFSEVFDDLEATYDLSDEIVSELYTRFIYIGLSIYRLFNGHMVLLAQGFLFKHQHTACTTCIQNIWPFRL